MPYGDSLSIDQVLALLAATPQRIATLTASLEPARLHTVPPSDEWSANDVLAHLRACADVWGGCIVTIIAQDEPTLRAVNPRSWIDKTDYPKQGFRPSLHAFTAQRTGLLAVLEPLPRESWSRTATVTGAGAILERTILFYARKLSGHERVHLKQLEHMLTALRIEQKARHEQTHPNSSPRQIGGCG
jgi:hypothetical protein